MFTKTVVPIRSKKGAEYYLHPLSLENYHCFSENLISLYRHIFAQPPYNESFDPQELDHTFITHLKDGNYLFALSTIPECHLDDPGTIPVIGFLFLSNTSSFLSRSSTGSAIQSQSVTTVPLTTSTIVKSTDIKSQLGKFLPLENSLYIDDLAVADHLQGQGIGKAIFEWVFAQTGNRVLYLRTNNGDENQPVIKFYERLGFKTIDLVEHVSNERTDQTIGVDERIYMIKVP